MTRTVADAALLMNVLSRPDARDFMSLPHEARDYLPGSTGSTSAAQDRLSARHEGRPAGRRRGARRGRRPPRRRSPTPAPRVDEMPSFLTAEMLDGMARFFEARSYNDFIALPPRAPGRRAAVHRRVVHLARRAVHRARRHAGLRPGDGDARGRGRRLRSRSTSCCRRPRRSCAYEAELPRRATIRTTRCRTSRSPCRTTCPSSRRRRSTGPAARDGLPIGVQIIGRRFDDAGVLRVARLIEQLRPAQRAWPEPA